MHVLVEGRKNIHRLLLPLLQDNLYTQSRYILRRDTVDGMLLCNTLTGELVLLSPEEKRMFERLPHLSGPVLGELVSHRFAVPRDLDESRTVEQLQYLLLKRQEARKIITHYNILPTTYCNARCFYCYESGIPHFHMTGEIADTLVRFIAENHGDDSVTLEWFGGEPLIGKQTIDRICHAVDDLKISYSSRMVSNGYLFDDELVRHAREVWKLRRIQITLDGTHETYNRTKAFVSPGEDPYHRVLRNIGLLLSAGVYVNVRLNMDTHNVEDLSSLIDELACRFDDREYLYVYVYQLNDGAGFDPIYHTQKDMEQLKLDLNVLQKKLEYKGWRQYRNKKLPALLVTSCMAEDPRSVQCTPDGILSKCGERIYDHTIGTVKTGITSTEQVKWWQQRLAHQGCVECPLYPSCFRLLKNCPVNKEKCTAYDLEHRIAYYLDLMLEKYEAWKRGESHDGESGLPDEGGRPDC